MYKEVHCLRQAPYLRWKQRIIGGKVRSYRYLDDRTGHYYSSVYLWMFHPDNIAMRSMFYPAGRKSISKDVLGNLSNLGALVWWLDDGSVKLHDGNGKLCTQGFPRKQVELAADWFSRRFGVSAYISTENEIFFSSKELPKLLASIGLAFRRHALPECMRYKMGASDKMNSDDIEEAKEMRRQRDRRRYHSFMSTPAHRLAAREKARLRQQIRLSDPSYRARYNEYHRTWQRNYRAMK
jgi:hypothetical protein